MRHTLSVTMCAEGSKSEISPDFLGEKRESVMENDFTLDARPVGN